MAEFVVAPTETLVVEFRAAMRELTDPEVSDAAIDRLLERSQASGNRGVIRANLRYLVYFTTTDAELKSKIEYFKVDSQATHRFLASVPELKRFVDAARPVPAAPRTKQAKVAAQATRRSKRASGPVPSYFEGDRKAAAADSDDSTSDEDGDAYKPGQSDDESSSDTDDNQDVLERPQKRTARGKKAPVRATLHNAVVRGQPDACFDMSISNTRRATLSHDRLEVDETEVTHLLVQKGEQEVRLVTLLDRPLCDRSLGTEIAGAGGPSDGAELEARKEAVDELVEDLRYALRVDQRRTIDELVDELLDDDDPLSDDQLLEQLVDEMEESYVDELDSGFDAVRPEVTFVGESRIEPATQYQSMIDDMIMSRLDEVLSDSEAEALEADMAARDASDDRAVLQCLHELESGNTMANMLVTSARVVGQATDDELETLPFVVGFVLRNGDRVLLKKMTRGGGKRRSESAAASRHTPKWTRRASSGDSAATTWRRENNVRDAGQRMMTSYATDFDLENVHPKLHKILDELPSNENQMVSVREDKRGKPDAQGDDKPRKYMLLAQFRDPTTSKQVLVRHGFYINKAFADLLGKWLYRQPATTLGRTKAAREFAEELFPTAFSMRDPMIGHDIVVENDVLRDTATKETRELLPDHALPQSFRLLDVSATTGKITYRDARTNEKATALMPFLKSRYAADFDWQEHLLFDPGPAPVFDGGELSAEAAASVRELLASTAIFRATDDGAA